MPRPRVGTQRPSNEAVEVEIHGLASGGDGVGKQVGGDVEGRVTFVPLTAPGERVLARLQQAKKHHARGELLQLLQASTDRVAPVCDLFGRCGGCQWQHVGRPVQIAAKTAIVRRVLAGQDLPGVDVEAVGPNLGYRDRARMVVGRSAQGKATLGFRARKSNDVVDVPDCPLLCTPLRKALPRIRERFLAAPTGTDVYLQAAGTHVVARTRDDNLIEGAHEGADPGNTSLDLAREGEPPLRIRAGDFAQVGAAANQALVKVVLELIGPTPGRMLELHAGSGNFTRFLVQRASAVVASDASSTARAAGSRNAPRADWRDPDAVQPEEAFDTILVDPPRTGLDEAALWTAGRTVGRLVYVSCDPQTFARDVKRLAEAGLRLSMVRALDLMPQTYHVELVALFVRADRA